MKKNILIEEIAKLIEFNIRNKFIDKFKAKDKGCKVKKQGKYDIMDLTIIDSKGNSHYLEIKTRFGQYDLAKLTQQGCWVEKLKMDKLYVKGAKYFTLIVITSDRYVLKAKIDYTCERAVTNSPHSTCFDNNKIYKEYLIQKNFINLGKLDDFLNS